MRKQAYKWIVSPILIIIISMLLSAFVLYAWLDFARFSYTIDEINKREIDFLINKYVQQQPFYDLVYGDENAPIIIIAVLGSKSQSTEYFINNIFPSVKSEFIDTGKVKFVIKQHISVKDIQENGERFKYAQTIACVKKVKPSIYYEFYFDLQNNEIEDSLEKINVSNEKLEECIENQSFDEIREDMLDVELFGMRGIEPRFYIGFGENDYEIINGIPPYSTFRRAIKSYQIVIGE